MNTRRFSRRNFLRTSALAVPLAAGGCFSTTGRDRAGAADFVTIQDGQFRLRGQPYCFIGANLWYACYLGNPRLPGGRARLVRELDRLQHLGVTDSSRALALCAAIQASTRILRGSFDSAEGEFGERTVFSASQPYPCSGGARLSQPQQREME